MWVYKELTELPVPEALQVQLLNQIFVHPRVSVNPSACLFIASDTCWAETCQNTHITGEKHVRSVSNNSSGLLQNRHQAFISWHQCFDWILPLIGLISCCDWPLHLSINQPLPVWPHHIIIIMQAGRVSAATDLIWIMLMWYPPRREA